MTSAATRLVALLGHPVAHSLSPRLHTAAFAAAGIDAVYVACDVAPDDLPAAVRGLEALGALGANLTVPHKVAVLRAVHTVSAEVDAVGAANTLFWQRPDQLCAANTDVTALQTVLGRDAGVSAGDHVRVFGAGGGARAAVVAAARLGAAVSIDARRPERARELQALARDCGAAHGPAAQEPQVVVNATPLGLHGEALPDRYLRLGAGQVALDLTYSPVGQPHRPPFLAAAERGGAVALDGVGMLVEQAAAAFTLWTGLPAPHDAMRAALT